MHSKKILVTRLQFIRDYKGIVTTIAIFVTVIGLFIYAINNASNNADESSKTALEKAIARTAVQCYAIEGFYPADLDYLVDNYGLVIDKKKYFVTYDTFASNAFPEIMVFNNY